VVYCKFSNAGSKPLPRSGYNFDDLMKFFHARQFSYSTNPKRIDSVIYTPYRYNENIQPPHVATSFRPSKVKLSSDGSETAVQPNSHTGDLLGVPELAPGTEGGGSNGKAKRKSKFDELPGVAEIFLFSYGTVVIWGMTEPQEKRFLSSLYVQLLRCISNKSQSQMGE
jgi:uncharacterized Rmd1/YagE family protein